MSLSCAILIYSLSFHVGATKEHNETHETFGVACEEFSVGYYKNSSNRDSIWAAKRWTNESGFFVEGGVVGGYKVSPILPMFRVGYSMTYADVFAAPAFERVKGESEFLPVIGIQFKVPF